MTDKMTNIDNGAGLLAQDKLKNRAANKKKSYLDWFVEVMLKQNRALNKDQIISAVVIEMILDDLKKRAEAGEKGLKNLDVKNNKKDQELFYAKCKAIRSTINHCVAKSKHRSSIHSNSFYKDLYEVQKQGKGKLGMYKLISKKQ